MSLPLHIVILAAGLGKRMVSDLPKVLHPLAGKPLLQHVIETAKALNPEVIHVIYGHGGERIQQALKGVPINWVYQEQPLGTGHAVFQALPFIPNEVKVLILSADVPLIQKNTLEQLIQKSAHSDATGSLALLVAKPEDPAGLGRIIRNENQAIVAIMEDKDASGDEKKIQEIYSGICAVNAGLLKRWLPKLQNNNAQSEYYLTSIIGMAMRDNLPIVSISAEDPVEIQGVNNRLQLQQLERIYQKRLAESLLMQGVSIADASRIDIRGELVCEKDVSIDVNCIFIGRVVLAQGSIIEANCILNNVVLEKKCHIHANSVLDTCHIGAYCQIGPFARLRPGTHLNAHCKIGNFVETKNVIFQEGSKANHLSYLGDANIGKQVNIGAGTITCNYDGANKHKTEIGDGVFIGSGTQLIAPIKIGENATIGAGSTIRKDAVGNELTLTKREQMTVVGWKRPKKY